MAYAQKNYGQLLGTGPDTIAWAGCFLTAFCNLLARYGEPVDPPTLNQALVKDGGFVRVPSGALDYLSWGSICKYDSNIVVTGIVNGNLPPTPNAIVRFHYNSVEPPHSPIDHFCLVDHIDGNQIFILDSWDGLVKAPAQYEPTYGNVVNYATYTRTAPVAPASKLPAPAGPAVSPSLDDTYEVIKDIPGYLSSSFAATHANSNSTVSMDHYFVFNRFNGMINVTRVPGQPGWWINPADNVIIPPAPEKPKNIAYTKLPKPYNLVVAKDSASVWNLGFDTYSHATFVSVLHKGDSFIAYGEAQRTDLDKPRYYMTQDAFGDADQTGIPARNEGVNEVDVSPPVATPAPAPATAPTPVTVNVVPSSPAVTTNMTTVADVVVSDWRATYRPFLGHNAMRTPQKYLAEKTYTVTDIAGQKRDVSLPVGWYVWISGTFVKDGIVYGRPKDAADRYLWYGIPMDEGIITPYQAPSSNDLFDWFAVGYESIARRASALLAALKGK